MAHKVLIADDEQNFGYAMCEFLKMNGYNAMIVNDGRSALEQYQSFYPDLMLLDVNMPEIDGFELARIVRTKDKEIPIIFITSLSEDKDVVNGFELGCNDYLKKPFGLKELLIRVERCLKLTLKRDPVFTFGYLKYAPKESAIYTQEGEIISLSANENKLLDILCHKYGHICQLEELYDYIWENSMIDAKKSLEALVLNLRRKISDTSLIVENIRGIGYRLNSK